MRALPLVLKAWAAWRMVASAGIGGAVVAAFQADAQRWRRVVADTQDALVSEHRQTEAAALDVGIDEGHARAGADVRRDRRSREEVIEQVGHHRDLVDPAAH